MLALSSSSLLLILSCHLTFIILLGDRFSLKHIDFLSIALIHFPRFVIIHKNRLNQRLVESHPVLQTSDTAVSR